MLPILLIGLLAAAVTPWTNAHSPFKKNSAPPFSSQYQSSIQQTSSVQSVFYTPPSSSLSSRANVPARNPFHIQFQWRIIDFEYPTRAARAAAIAGGSFVPENNLPLGVDRYGDRVFVTLPRWKNGVPASLAYLPLYDNADGSATSPAMRPYPSWSAHAPDPSSAPADCSRLMSVYRLWVDECQRLWVLDAGVVNATIAINPICPPKIVVFDLRTDQQIMSYELPEDQVKQDSLHSNIVVDIRDGQCDDAHAYVTDVWRFGVVVFSYRLGRSWRTSSPLYMPNPLASTYQLHGLSFQWTDGVFGLSLAPVNGHGDRLLFFHPMSSYSEFLVSTNVLRNETLWTRDGGQGAEAAFVQLGAGDERGRGGQSSTSGIAENGVMFYNLIQQDAVGCWDTAKRYECDNLAVAGRDNETLVFPNDMKLDRDQLDQNLWVLSNRLPIYLYATLDFSDVNFRIQRVSVAKAVAGTICDPYVAAAPSKPIHPAAQCF